ncbi:MAG: flagellar hook-basal body complex protein FliE [Spirochaetales bacterium]|nr:flagellar hook-basal body complex protein FliE [Spirochaetales bacterium]
MNILQAGGVTGDVVMMNKTHQSHLPGIGETRSREKPGDFGALLTGALEDANSLQQESTALATSFLTDPESVDAHDVTIAMAKANMAVQITKQVLDGAIQAYKDIINVR